MAIILIIQRAAVLATLCRALTGILYNIVALESATSGGNIIDIRSVGTDGVPIYEIK
jgi:hypothetical protein